MSQLFLTKNLRKKVKGEKEIYNKSQNDYNANPNEDEQDFATNIEIFD